MRIKHIVFNIPQQPLSKALGDAIAATLSEEARQAKRNFERSVRTWQDKPIFEIKRAGLFTEATIQTSHAVYYYVTHGTRPHIIRARRAPRLRFNTEGFIPKTMPARLDVGAGRLARPPVAYRLSVMHPGMEARAFDVQVATLADGRLYKVFTAKLQRTLRA